MTTADERGAITMAKLWLQYGERGLAQALTVLVSAAENLLGQSHCTECGGAVTVPVHDPETLAWLGDAAPVFCSLACREVADERRINAAGNGPS